MLERYAVSIGQRLADVTRTAELLLTFIFIQVCQIIFCSLCLFRSGSVRLGWLSWLSWLRLVVSMSMLDDTTTPEQHDNETQQEDREIGTTRTSRKDDKKKECRKENTKGKKDKAESQKWA